MSEFNFHKRNEGHEGLREIEEVNILKQHKEEKDLKAASEELSTRDFAAEFAANSKDKDKKDPLAKTDVKTE
jgi:hypothetical protein